MRWMYGEQQEHILRCCLWVPDDQECQLVPHVVRRGTCRADIALKSV
jgi:hypothetical protein